MNENTRKEEFRVEGEKVWQKIKELFRAGNIRHIVLKNKQDEQVFSMTVTIAVILVVLIPQVILIITLVALFAHYTIVGEKEEGRAETGSTE